MHWLDALMLVFNVDDELSSSVLPSYYSRMCHYRDFSNIPIFLVGIKGKLSFNGLLLYG